MSIDAVRAALVADARTDVELLMASADREGEEQLTTAREEAASLIDSARAQGERDADERLARQRAASRREAREIVLTARRRAFDELHERARDAVRALAGEDRYPELVERLRALVEAQLGPDALIVVDPGDEPGVVGTDGGRRVDYRLAKIAERLVDDLWPFAEASLR